MINEALVKSPEHYNVEGRKECWDEMIDGFGIEAVVTFDVLNAYKYYYRAGLKKGNPEEQDLKKIEEYMNHAHKLIESGKVSTKVQMIYLEMKDLLEREER